MSYIETTPPALARGETREMYRRQQARWGHVPNYARVFSARPELMALWAGLLAGIRRHVDARRFELVTLAAALAQQNSYCALAHGEALCAHFDAEQVRDIAMAVREGRDPAMLDVTEAAIVRYAARAAHAAHRVGEEEIDSLRRCGLADVEIFDIAAVVAARRFFAGLLDSLGAEPDSHWCGMEPGLRDALVVGRTPSRAPPERVE